MRLGSLGRGIFFVYVILHATGCTGTSEESEPFVKGFHNGIPVEFMGCNLRIPESFFRAAVGEYNREDSLIRLRSKPFDHAAVTSDIGVTDFESKEYGEYILHSFSVSVSEELSFWQQTLVSEGAHINLINISSEEANTILAGCP